MIKENAIVSFFGEAGNRRADISIDEWRNQPYVVEYYIKDEWIGFECFKDELLAEAAATKYTFGDK